jgi:hypothetical protein
MLMVAILPTALQFRESAFVLSARAMLRLNEGKTEDAQQDIQACHRLARLEGQASTLLHELIVDSIETFIACRGDAIIVAYGNLTAKQAAQFQADLRKLSSMPRVIDKLNTAERYAYLDTATAIMHGGPKVWEDSFNTDNEWENLFDPNKQLNSTVKKLMTLNKIDWNEVLRSGNENFDKLVEAASKKTRAERITAIRASAHSG